MRMNREFVQESYPDGIYRFWLKGNKVDNLDSYVRWLDANLREQYVHRYMTISPSTKNNTTGFHPGLLAVEKELDINILSKRDKIVTGNFRAYRRNSKTMSSLFIYGDKGLYVLFYTKKLERFYYVDNMVLNEFPEHKSILSELEKQYVDYKPGTKWDLHQSVNLCHKLISVGF